MVDFHPDRSLPDCMMPDGGECCRGYYELVVDWRRLKTAAKGWISISDELPPMDAVVVCTNGKARWLEARTSYCPDMNWHGHAPTHWHPLADLPGTPTAGPRT